MKVIMDNNPENKTELVCYHCKSILEIYASDIIYNEFAHHCSTFEITCAACGKRIGINEKMVPQSWLISAIGDLDD